MVDTESLLTKTDAFLRTMHVVRDHYGLKPVKDHIGTCINHADLQEMRERFVEELTNTVVAFVYSPSKWEKMKVNLVAEGRDGSSAERMLYKRARKKFRPSSLQGQFSELLLCNLLQHHFRAVPLVRKMSITTNPALERNGADAIHIAKGDNGYKLFIGEAKTYNRQRASLQAALRDAVNDVVAKHYLRHRDELSLYTYEDFVPDELEQIARGYCDGTLADVEVHLVCVVTYDQPVKATGADRDARLASVIEALRTDAAKVKCDVVLDGVPEELLPRLHYILFPVSEMDGLIEAFRKELNG